MPNDSRTQQALARDPIFVLRLQNALGKIAWQVLNEPTTTPNHPARALYAQNVIKNSFSVANAIVPSFVLRPNVLAFTTSFDFYQGVSGAVVTASGDADIESQLATDWNLLSA